MEKSANVQWEILDGKIRKVLERHAVLREENRRLVDQVKELEAELHRQREAFRDLGQQHEQLKLAHGLTADPETVKQTKARINEMLREIDTCIALLNE